MASKKKLLQAAAGSASGGAAAGGTNVEDFFQVHLYDTNGKAQNADVGLTGFADAPEDDVVVHLNGDALTDQSPYAHTVTTAGSTSTLINTSTKKFGTGSYYFDGSGDRVRVADYHLVLGENDFTVEFWINLPDASPVKGVFHLWDNSAYANYSMGLYYTGNDFTLQMKDETDGQVSAISTNSNVLSNNTWHHVAIERYEDVCTMYIDGTSVGTANMHGQNLIYQYLELGTHWDNAYTMTGYIDDFRITKNRARYQGNFTAPTAAHSADTMTTDAAGGMVWLKHRGLLGYHTVYDTVRGAQYAVYPNVNNAQSTARTGGLASFTKRGYNLGNFTWENNSSGGEALAYAWKRQENFFDVVTYTGNGTSSNSISHNLGVVPGMIMIKSLNVADNWLVSCAGNNGGTNWWQYTQKLDEIDAEVNSNYLGQPTSTTLEIATSNSQINGNGQTYVAYIWANHDSTGTFGESGDQDIIKVGTMGSGSSAILGWKPQWVLIKKRSGTGQWAINDVYRGFTYKFGYDETIYPDSDSAAGNNTTDYWGILNKGFYIEAPFGGGDYIYMAIRAPMETPTKGSDALITSKDHKTAYTWDHDPMMYARKGFKPEMSILSYPGGSNNNYLSTLMTNRRYIVTDTTNGSSSQEEFKLDYDGAYHWNPNLEGYIATMFRERPGHFDVAFWLGTGTAVNVAHNLGVIPEMMWVKRYEGIEDWNVYHKDLAATEYMQLNQSSGKTSSNGTLRWDSTRPTDSVFRVGSHASANASSEHMMALLFATVDGVTKVGSYTGTGSNINIDCGFTNGARFVLIKRMDANGDWWFMDTTRGISTGNDSLLAFNTASAELTTTDQIDPYSAGFTVANTATADFNASGGTYLFYAVAT